jgi:acetoin utilization protein AcuB
MSLVPVGQVMTKDVISISPDLGVDVALEMMGARSIRRLPVLSDTGRLIGIITREDARVALEEARTNSPDAPPVPKVRETMSDYVYTVSPGESIAEAAQLMISHNVGALPVLEDKKLVGIVTESDLFEYLARHLGETDS